MSVTAALVATAVILGGCSDGWGEDSPEEASEPGSSPEPESEEECIDSDGDGYFSNCEPRDCPGVRAIQDASLNPGAEELCDHKDNNCNGQIDEGFDVGEPCQKQHSICVTEGIIECVDRFTSECNAPEPPLKPSEEVCDGVDNDCNGLVDDGLETQQRDCFAGEGACRQGGVERLFCEDGREHYECNALPGNPEEEICDGIDNDCDGVIDNVPLEITRIPISENWCRFPADSYCTTSVSDDGERMALYSLSENFFVQEEDSFDGILPPVSISYYVMRLYEGEVPVKIAERDLRVFTYPENNHRPDQYQDPLPVTWEHGSNIFESFVGIDSMEPAVSLVKIDPESGDITPLASTSEWYGDYRVSWDGEQIAGHCFVPPLDPGEERGVSLCVMDQDGETMRVINEEPQEHPFPIPDYPFITSWFPDNEHVLIYRQYWGVYSLNTITGARTFLMNTGMGHRSIPSSSGDYVAILGSERSPEGGGLYLWNTDTEEMKKIEEPDCLVEGVDICYRHSFSWSPSGRWLMFGLVRGVVGRLYIMDVQTSEIEDVSDTELGAYATRSKKWLSNRNKILVSGETEEAPNSKDALLIDLPCKYRE